MELLQSVNLVSITVRLLLALACGGVLGIDRERNHRPAGFRTYTLVCIGSALVMMTSQYVLQTIGGGAAGMSVGRAGAVAAASFLMTCPTVIIFTIMQGKVMETMTYSGIKG